MEFLKKDIDRVKELFETGNFLKMQQEMDVMLKERTKQLMEEHRKGKSFE